MVRRYSIDCEFLEIHEYLSKEDLRLLGIVGDNKRGKLKEFLDEKERRIILYKKQVEETGKIKYEKIENKG